MSPSIFECSLVSFIILSMCHSITESPGIQRVISKDLSLVWEVKGWIWGSGVKGTLEQCREDYKVTYAGMMLVSLLSRHFQSRTRVKGFLGKHNLLKAIADILLLIFFGLFFFCYYNTSVNNFAHILHLIFSLGLILK